MFCKEFYQVGLVGKAGKKHKQFAANFFGVESHSESKKINDNSVKVQSTSMRLVLSKEGP